MTEISTETSQSTSRLRSAIDHLAEEINAINSTRDDFIYKVTIIIEKEELVFSIASGPDASGPDATPRLCPEGTKQVKNGNVIECWPI